MSFKLDLDLYEAYLKQRIEHRRAQVAADLLVLSIAPQPQVNGEPLALAARC